MDPHPQSQLGGRELPSCVILSAHPVRREAWEEPTADEIPEVDFQPQTSPSKVRAACASCLKATRLLLGLSF